MGGGGGGGRGRRGKGRDWEREGGGGGVRRSGGVTSDRCADVRWGECTDHPADTFGIFSDVDHSECHFCVFNPKNLIKSARLPILTRTKRQWKRKSNPPPKGKRALSSQGTPYILQHQIRSALVLVEQIIFIPLILKIGLKGKKTDHLPLLLISFFSFSHPFHSYSLFLLR